MNLMNNPAVKVACAQLSAEVASIGVYKFVDNSLDYVAKKIAYHIVEKEKEERK